jgi:putative DNA methylase
MSNSTPYRKKLIEVALPLNAINEASVREKSIRHGHPSTLHLWWSRKPLATCRAVLFASLIDDPSSNTDLSEQEQEEERKRLFDLIEAMVKWENANNDDIMEKVHAEIRIATNSNPPPVLDPFAGGGSIPLEAQRLGLEAHASDLNPVAVLINKALIEIPPKFAGRAPVNPEAQRSLLGEDWHGARGLADDVRYYGKWMRDEAERRIGHLYPKVTLPKAYGGGEATVIAWLWVRTVTCPNPACGTHMPLTSKWWLSKKMGKQTWAVPIVNREEKAIHFEIKTGKPDAKVVKEISMGSCFVGEKGKKVKATFACMACGAGVVKGDYIDKEANEGRMGVIPLAIVAEGNHGRVYLPFDTIQTERAFASTQTYLSETGINQGFPNEPAKGTFASNAQGRLYGFKTFSDYFTPRQLVALTTFSNLVQEARERVLADAERAGLLVDGVTLNDGGTGANAYADAVATYLGFAVDRCTDYWSSICSWNVSRDNIRNTFARQAIPMTWDFAETNPMSSSSGNFQGALDWVLEVITVSPCGISSKAQQHDATTTINTITQPLISTDPPYYDNSSYADLSDFFYVWLRRSLGDTYPDLFRTMLVPKAPELVATPYRFGGSKSKAQEFFETGLSHAFERMRAVQSVDYPMTVYYAFKQAESESDEADDTNDESESESSTTLTASTGWETMLEGLVRSGFTITGTWPMRTERTGRTVGIGTNALASSIVLVCRARPVEAPVISRRQFINELRATLPDALTKLQHGGIAPVDLAQASIGPGMAIYSRYSKVVESDGTPLRVRTALQLINRTLDEVLAEQEGEYDAETRWAIAWFEEYAHTEGEYGRAETLSKAKNTGLHGLVEAGLLSSKGGKVRLLRRDELPAEWHLKGRHVTVWEVMQRMIEALDKQGFSGAGDILRMLSEQGELARDLAYRLYTLCERKGWAAEALAYNSLVTSWSEISRLARREAGERQLWEATFLG